ncbi:MAG: DUF5076 domain-containing protein [Planctomycetaceae bacterium]
MRAGELPVPSPIDSDPRAIELLRIWAAHGKQHVSLATNVWDDPAAWGIMLVDLAKHVASAYQQTTGKEYTSLLNRVREGFDAEWQSATDEPSGQVQ